MPGLDRGRAGPEPRPLRRGARRPGAVSRGAQGRLSPLRVSKKEAEWRNQIRDASISPSTVHFTNSMLQSVRKVLAKCLPILQNA